MTPRATGYYWVQFNWPKFGRQEIRWEPASWDARSNFWAMIGSAQLVPADREHDVFIEIDETPMGRTEPR